MSKVAQSAHYVPCTLCFSTLGIESRMKIYAFIKEQGKSTVTSVVDYIGLTQPTISYHLKEMKEAGLLLSEKHGKEVLYGINMKCPVHKRDCVLCDVKFTQEVTNSMEKNHA